MITSRPVDDLVAALHQDEHWTSRDGDDLVTHRLDDMHDRHRGTVLAWLRARALELHRRQHDEHVASVARGEHPHDVLVLIADHGRLDPYVWLEETPLVRRLVQLQGHQPRPERRRRLLPARLRWRR